MLLSLRCLNSPIPSVFSDLEGHAIQHIYSDNILEILTQIGSEQQALQWLNLTVLKLHQI